MSLLLVVQKLTTNRGVIVHSQCVESLKVSHSDVGEGGGFSELRQNSIFSEHPVCVSLWEIMTDQPTDEPTQPINQQADTMDHWGATLSEKWYPVKLSFLFSSRINGLIYNIAARNKLS